MVRSVMKRDRSQSVELEKRERDPSDKRTHCLVQESNARPPAEVNNTVQGRVVVMRQLTLR